MGIIILFRNIISNQNFTSDSDYAKLFEKRDFLLNALANIF